MTETIDLICFKCKHWSLIGCAAFPEGVPDEILLTNVHDKPLPEQDNDLVFQKKQNNNDESK